MRNFLRRHCKTALIGIALHAVCVAAACAQGLRIMPVSIGLQSGQFSAVASIVNATDTQQTIQARPLLWEQSSGTDKLTPTEVLAVSPPLAVIEPGATQVFRILLREPAQSLESSYRLLFDELPSAVAGGQGIRVMLRLSVPVFAQPAETVASQVSWSVLVDSQGAVLHAENHGGKHLRIIHLELNRSPAAPLTAPTANAGYILPGATRDWPIAGARHLEPGSVLHLIAVSDQGPVDTVVNVQQK